MEEIVRTFGINWKLLSFQAINFAIVLAVLYRFLYKPLLRLMEERQTKITQGVKDAEAAAQELREADEKKKILLTRATQEAEHIVEVAKKTAGDERDQMIKNAGERSATIVSDAQRQGEDEKRRILDEGKDEIARIAVLAAEKILRAKP